MMTYNELVERIAKAERDRAGELNLSGRRLTSLPAEIGRLTDLTKLDLSDNALTALPSTIGALKKLTVLSVSSNRLSALPAEIGRLTNLTKLNLWRNHLTSVPTEIGRLTALTNLCLSNNQLNALPAEIGSLTALTQLDVDDNRLLAVPAEIGRLTNLNRLNLSKNQLVHLPQEIGELVRLVELDLRDNPLTSPPQEVILQGARAVLTYLQAQRTQGVRRLWYSKMVLVGEGGVGKTSLLRALRDESFDEQEESTQGMDAHMKAHEALELPHPTLDDVKMRLYIWDFGGQQIYHATHQFFLTDKSLLVLVWNGRLGYEQCRLEYWLEMLKARAPVSPIVIVATHADQRPAEPLPLREWRKKYNIVAQHEVSNKTGGGIDELKQQLSAVAAELPIMGQEYPQNWVKAIETMQNTFMQYRKDPHMARDYFHLPGLLELLYAQHGMEEDEAHVMLHWFHHLGGVLLYPDDPELSDLAILNPWWASRVINRVFDHQDPTLDRGVFTGEHAREIWHDVPEWLRPRFLRLMEKFDLCYRIPGNGSSIVVGRLPAEPPDYQEHWDDLADDTPQLTLRYRFDAIPAGIPSWFIAREHRFSTGLQWRHGVLLADEGNRHAALLRADPHERFVELRVRGPYPQDFFALLKDGIEVTLARFPGLNVRRCLPCPCQPDGEACEEEYQYEVLLGLLDKGKETISCHRSGDDVAIRTLLFGWSAGSQNDLLADIDERLRGQEQHFTHLLEQNRELIALSQRNHLIVCNTLQSSQEYHCPNVFSLRLLSQGRIKELATQKLELQLFCQEPGHWHPTEAGGRYVFERPAEWLQPIIPYARKLAALLRYAAPVVGLVGKHPAWHNIAANVGSMEELLTEMNGRKTLHETDESTAVDGAALRQLRRLLDELDRSQNWGGLKKVYTAEGHYLWLCPQHAAKYKR